jgi:hypothetical protein
MDYEAARHKPSNLTGYRLMRATCTLHDLLCDPTELPAIGQNGQYGDVEVRVRPDVGQPRVFPRELLPEERGCYWHLALAGPARIRRGAEGLPDEPHGLRTARRSPPLLDVGPDLHGPAKTSEVG